MHRRLFFLLPLALKARADPQQEIFDLFTSLATALSGGNAPGFLQGFDPQMPDYQTLANEITALVAQADLVSSIEVLSDTGDAARREVQLDWFLQIQQKQEAGGLTRRRQVVKCRLEKQKKKWRIVRLDPVAFFAPPQLR